MTARPGTRRTRRRLGLAALVVAVATSALAFVGAALAHPLGNFTVNRHAGLTASGDRVYLTYVLDLAEIPTFQARDEARDGDGYASALAAGIRDAVELTLGGEPVELTEREHRLTFPEGSGGLPTTRFEVIFESGPLAAGPRALAYRDTGFSGKIGWKEVTLGARDGAEVTSTDLPAASVSDALRAYPDDLLSSPLDVTAGTATLSPGSGRGVAPRLDPGDEPSGTFRTPAERGFESLVGERELSAGFVLVAVIVALFWGAVHALSPGHGKGVVAAYLVGTRGTPRHALYLGVIVTVTHTLGVFTLGLVTLALSEFIVPEQLYPWLNLASAVLVMAVGVAVLRSRLARWLGLPVGGGHDHGHSGDHGGGSVRLGSKTVRLRHAHDGHGHDHDHQHDHDHDHHHHHGPGGHSHVPEPGTGWRGIVGVGIASGIVPCPTALVVLLAAISLQRVGFGLLLIVAFSVGLAATMTAIGLLAVWGKARFERTRFDGPVLRALPALSAIAIVGLGVVMALRAIPELA